MEREKEFVSMRDYVGELREVTNVIRKHITGESRDALEVKKILEYAKKVNAIHANLTSSYGQYESDSKVIERFFKRWNNLMLGVFYMADISMKGKVFSEKQLDIIFLTIDEITKYTGKHLSD